MTPCEKLGYKVGDLFRNERNHHKFVDGERVTLSWDDGSNCPFFVGEEGTREAAYLHNLTKMPGTSITLRPGDYCSTANMTEREYHAVAAAFMAAGCDADMHGHLDYGKVPSQPYLEWYRTDLCSTTKPEPGGRHLTPAQIIGAVNAKTEVKGMKEFKKGDKVVLNGHRNDGDDYEAGITPSIERWAREDTVLTVMGDAITPKCYKVTDGKSDAAIHVTEMEHFSSCGKEQKHMHPIDNLHTKRQARDVAEQQYQAALAEVREVYPWIRVEEKVEQPTEDMSDPKNWRAGDIVKYSGEGFRPWYTSGKEYELKKQGGRLGVIDNDGDFMAQSVKAGRFTFIRRP